LTAQKGTHESDPSREWEGSLEIVSPADGTAIRSLLSPIPHLALRGEEKAAMLGPGGGPFFTAVSAYPSVD
jgi:hypothetical protein